MPDQRCFTIHPGRGLGLKINVNGKSVATSYAPDTPLLWVLRDELKLKGTKYGCGIGFCGACTVHVDGEAVRSCITPLEAVANTEVTTIEGLSENAAHPVQRAWIDHDVPQCGYCQTGFIMETAALLVRNPHPSEEEIATTLTNICRCGTYDRIRAAIRDLTA